MEAALTAVLRGLLIHRHERTLVPVPPPSNVYFWRKPGSRRRAIVSIPITNADGSFPWGTTHLRSSRCRLYETSVMSSVKFETGIRTGSGRTSSRRKPNAL
jgi:hypothetical protein